MTARLALLLALTAGCNPSASKPATKGGPAPPAADEPAADDPPGMNRWSDAQIQEAVRESLSLTSVSLTKESRERYTGTGTDANRRTVKLAVRYRPGEYRVDYETPDPNSPGRVRKSNYHWAAEGVKPKWRDTP